MAQSSSSYYTSFPKLDVINVQSLFDPIVPETKLIALGDAAPGSEEGFQTKSIIIQNLIFKNYYRHLILQMDFMAAWHLEVYISGDGYEWKLPSDLPVEWNNKSFRDLIEWIRERNLATSDDKQKVHIWGLNACQVPLSKLNESVIQQFAPQILDELNAIYKNPLISRREKVNEIKKVTQSIMNSNQEWTYQTMLIRNIIVSYQNALESYETKNTFTEEYTAKMILELINQLDNSERFVLWAENNRIDKRKTIDNSFGYYLNLNMGKKYVAIGGDFYEGRVQLFHTYDSAGVNYIRPIVENCSLIPTSISEITKSNNKGVLWIDVSLAPKEWVKQNRVYNSITYNTKPIPNWKNNSYFKRGNVWKATKSFDYFLILDQVHPVIP